MSDEMRSANLASKGDHADEHTGRRIIRWPEVYNRTQRSRTQTWRDIRNGKFPAPVELGPHAVGWFADEIDDWLANLPRALTSGPGPEPEAA